MKQQLALIYVLFKRDTKARYRRTFLGWLWVLIPPIVTIVIFNVLRGIVNIPSEGVPYIVFSTVSIVPWTLFAGIVTSSAPSVLSNSSIMKKSSIPREIFPVVGMLGALLDFSIACALIVAMMFFYHISLAPVLLWFPVLVILTALLGLGIGMGISAVAVYRRDFLRGTPYVIQLLLFATPIAYPLSQVSGHLKLLYVLNPMVGLIEGFRSIILFGRPPDLGLLGISVVLMLLILVLAWPFFRVMSQYFADVV